MGIISDVGVIPVEYGNIIRIMPTFIMLVILSTKMIASYFMQMET